MTKGGKSYAVKSGREPGIYHSSGAMNAQTSGYSNNVARSFKSESDAQAYMNCPCPNFNSGSGNAAKK